MFYANGGQRMLISTHHGKPESSLLTGVKSRENWARFVRNVRLPFLLFFLLFFLWQYKSWQRISNLYGEALWRIEPTSRHEGIHQGKNWARRSKFIHAATANEQYAAPYLPRLGRTLFSGLSLFGSVSLLLLFFVALPLLLLYEPVLPPSASTTHFLRYVTQRRWICGSWNMLPSLKWKKHLCIENFLAVTHPKLWFDTLEGVYKRLQSCDFERVRGVKVVGFWGLDFQSLSLQTSHQQRIFLLQKSVHDLQNFTAHLVVVSSFQLWGDTVVCSSGKENLRNQMETTANWSLATESSQNQLDQTSLCWWWSKICCCLDPEKENIFDVTITMTLYATEV